MPPRFRGLLLVSFVLALTFLFAASTGKGSSYEGQTLERVSKDAGVESHSKPPESLPFPGEEAAEIERKKHPKPADGQIQIPGQPAPAEDIGSGSSPSKLESIPTARPETQEDEPVRVVADEGFRTTGSRTVQEQFEEEHDHIRDHGIVGAVFGRTMNDLVNTVAYAAKYSQNLLKSKTETRFTDHESKIYNPYPNYNSAAWKADNGAAFVECEYPKSEVLGPSGDEGEVLVFPGQLKDFPLPSFGSYIALGVDQHLCYERQTRLGAYGYIEGGSSKSNINWDKVNWRALQEKCVRRNANRYDKTAKGKSANQLFAGPNESDGKEFNADQVTSHFIEDREVHKTKARSALILRAYSGKNYTENDKQIIRSLITELSLKSGGEYEVFLLVQVKDNSIPIWSDNAAYDLAVQEAVPEEFWGITVLWNDAMMRTWYPKLSPPYLPEKVSSVHVAQWLSVQKFAQERPEFEYYWNWELDSRYTGHHYELLEKLAAFGARQPRKGLWERSERYYNPSIHGNYDTDFRKRVEALHGDESVWGPPNVPDIEAIGPNPPVGKPSEDNYEWGVGEEADYITLGPIFNPKGTAWVGQPDVWGYEMNQELPRRTTIITQSRCSKRLLDAMHYENLKGKHVSSEMTPQTVALLHGLKAVYAPHPVWFDREWRPESLERWFNGGTKGQSGSYIESPFGWGREGRFQGSTWYYRADTPGRLYNNWMGWEDTEIGGTSWESQHGRVCLPPILLHPIKDVEQPPPGYSSKSYLPY